MSIINSEKTSSFFNPVKSYESTLKHFNASKTASATKSQDLPQLTSDEEMKIFKEEFYKELEQIQCHCSVKNVTVNVSEKAFAKMKDDPEYKEKIMNLLKRDLTSSYAPRDTSVMLTVGESLNQYRGDSWPTSNDSEFWWRSENSFYRMTDNNSRYGKNPYSEEKILQLIGQSSLARLNLI